MKKIFLKWLPFFVVAAMCVGFTSYGDDDDDIRHVKFCESIQCIDT
jgi:hypothetical protein